MLTGRKNFVRIKSLLDQISLPSYISPFYSSPPTPQKLFTSPQPLSQGRGAISLIYISLHPLLSWEKGAWGMRLIIPEKGAWGMRLIIPEKGAWGMRLILPEKGAWGMRHCKRNEESVFSIPSV
jgi:hypothetical protein